MIPPSTTSEITELKEPNSLHRSKSPSMGTSKANKDATIAKKLVRPEETDLIGLLEGRDPRNLSRIIVPHTKGVDLLQKSALKRPVKIGTSYASGIGISESVTLKQALRKLCISQASEMAAMRRLSKPIGVSVSSEAGNIKRLYSSIVVQVSESGTEEHEKLQEISFLSEKHTSKASQKKNEPSKIDGGGISGKVSGSSSHKSITTSVRVVKPRIRDVLSSTSECGRKSPARVVPQKKEKTKFKSSMSLTKSSDSCKSDVSPRFVKPAVKNKSASSKKRNCDTSSDSISSRRNSPADKIPTTLARSKSGGKKEPACSASGTMKLKSTILEKNSCDTKPNSTPISSGGGPIGMKSKEFARSKGEYSHSSKSSIGDYSSGTSINGMKSKEFSRSKGECSYSSKSSIGDYSSSTSINGDSNQSGSSGMGVRPHMSNDVRWAAIRHVETSDRGIGLKNFKILNKLGSGDIGTVYVAELTGMGCLFALKVMDIEFLISRKKMIRAQTEREILQMLDHPFLPTLYAHFTTDNLSCLVMEYCPGGDLHVLRQKQLGGSFSEPAARFYMAEVLLALEYLHMLGVVYRDLKPENILVREDGHIMLSDFDLSLHCTVNPTLPRLSSVGVVESTGRISGVCSQSHCIDPLCLRPSWAQVSCFTPRLASLTCAMTRKHTADLSTRVGPFPQLVVEPTEARSNSFVGTHEYLAPEIIKGECHGSSVDWWTLGIFLYELLFGRTPFKGPNNEVTLANVVCQSLRFPDSPVVSCHARDLIRGLLVKEPENRVGAVKGAAEIKGHPFFMGLNWALIRCATPPEVPQPYDYGIQLVQSPKKKESKYMEFSADEDGVEFELF